MKRNLKEKFVFNCCNFIYINYFIYSDCSTDFYKIYDLIV